MADLNPPQAEAVAHVDGPLLVFAGAGSGKTRVITYRIANLVARARVAPWRILAVTFTNKAAGEMRERLLPMLGDEICRELQVGTFHAICARLLRRHGEAIGVPKNFVIYDTADQRSAMTRVVRELDLAADGDKRFTPRALLSRAQKEKQEGRSPATMNLDAFGDEVVKKAWTRYEQMLEQAGALDFEDLILKTLYLLRSETPEAEQLRSRFTHVLVDEFQDTNGTQYGLLRALSDRHRNLCVVGDDDQSIYAWRGADVKNIRGFSHDFPDAKVVKLEQNYRSTGHVVQAALGIISRSRNRVEKELWTENEPGAPVAIVATADERDEAAQVVEILRRARDAGTAPKQIAVFYRVHAQSRVLEEALRAANYAYDIVGGTKFYERAEVKDALSYLRILENPASDVDLLRIINVPARGIGQTTLERITDLATALGVPLWDALDRLDENVPSPGDDEFFEEPPKSLQTPLFAMPKEFEEAPYSAREGKKLNNATKKKLTLFKQMISALRSERERLTPDDLLDRVLAVTGYRAALEAEKSIESEARLENLAELHGSLADYAAMAQAAGETPSLGGYLERVSLVSDLDGVGKEERVTLMTVHGAKGLEFEVVVVTGMEEDMFPYRGMAQRGSLDPEEFDEERRLAYVAVTRARKNLFLTWARGRQIFGTSRYGARSRFIDDIPREICVDVPSPTFTATAQEGRYIDRGFGGYGGGKPAALGRPNYEDDDGWSAPSFASKKAPIAAKARTATPPAEGRFIEIDPEFAAPFFDEGPVRDAHGAEDAPPSGPLRKGSRVFHKKFGEGQVVKVLDMASPSVLAFFPGWGEMKVLTRFLEQR